MSVAIFTENPVLERVLTEAFEKAGIFVEKKDNNPKIVVFDASNNETTHLPENINCPLLLIGDNTKNLTANEKFKAKFRIGHLIDRVQYYFKIIESQRCKKEINIGDMVLSYQDSVLKKPDQNPIPLTEKEVMILSHLYHHNEKAISRQALLDAVWGYAQNVETHTLETHIYRLRQKIEDIPAEPRLLITEDEGYRLNL